MATQSDDEIKQSVIDRRNNTPKPNFVDTLSASPEPPANPREALLYAWNYGIDMDGQPHLDRTVHSNIIYEFMQMGCTDPFATPSLNAVANNMPQSLIDKGVQPQVYIYLCCLGFEWLPSTRSSASGYFDIIPFLSNPSQEFKTAQAQIIEGVVGNDPSKRISGWDLAMRVIVNESKKQAGLGSTALVIAEHDKNLWEQYYSLGGMLAIFLEHQRQKDATKGTPNAGASGNGDGSSTNTDQSPATGSGGSKG